MFYVFVFPLVAGGAWLEDDQFVQMFDHHLVVWIASLPGGGGGGGGGGGSVVFH